MAAPEESGPPPTPTFSYGNVQLKRKAEHLAFDVENWYPPLAARTFETVILPFSRAEASACVAYYQTAFNHRDHLDNDGRRTIAALVARIDAAVADNPDTLGRDGFFVRLSSRSPKDAVSAFGPSMTDLYEAELAALRADPALQVAAYPGDPEASEANTTLRALARAQGRALQAASGEDAVDRLLKSERVFVDLRRALDCAETDPDDVWSTSLILRAWDAGLRDDREFRVFVYQGTLCAISQYNHTIAFPELRAEGVMETVTARIEAAFRDIHPIVSAARADGGCGLDSYIVDFGFCGDDVATAPIRLIELNPYAKSTGAAMFHWSETEELEQAPVSVRIRTTPILQLAEFAEVNLDMVAELSSDPPFWDLVRIDGEPPVDPWYCAVL